MNVNHHYSGRACPNCKTKPLIWHLLETDEHKCDCLCRDCWASLSIAGRVAAYASLEHHSKRGDWEWMAPAIWSGK